MSVFDHAEFDHHEQVLFCHDERFGLFAIIAIHSTALGPAAGGCRMLPYATFDEALTDVLRLSKGMTYKNAVAGLPLGGGKCVIVGDPSRPEKAELLRAFSRHVQGCMAGIGQRSTWGLGRPTPTFWRRTAITSLPVPANIRRDLTHRFTRRWEALWGFRP